MSDTLVSGGGGSWGSYGSDVPIVSLDVSITRVGTREGLGFQPLRHALRELTDTLHDRRQFHDGQEWLRRFWFATAHGGLPVLRVDPGGPAEIAGLRVCDVIVGINSKDCRTWSQKRCAKTIKESLVKSDTIVLSLVRCTALPYDPSTCAVFADQARNSKAQNFSVTVRIPIRPENTVFGFTPLKYSLTDTELPRFERCMVKEIRRKLPFAVGGLPVQIVDPDGPAAQAGLQPWDVIAIQTEEKAPAAHLNSVRQDTRLVLIDKMSAETAEREEAVARHRALMQAREIRARRLSFHRQRKQSAQARRRALQSVSYAIASIAGDPHLRTFDGRSVLLSTRGDFVLLRGKDYEIQARVRFANRAAGAGYVIGIAAQLPGTNGDLIGISSQHITINNAPSKMFSGLNPISGGSVLFGKDEHKIPYIKISMSNGIFITINWGAKESSRVTSLNVALAAPADLLKTASGILTDKAINSTDEAQESNTALVPLFAGPIDSDDIDDSVDANSNSNSDLIVGTTTQLVTFDDMSSAVDLCRRAFTGVDQVWSKCPAACSQTSARLATGHCLVDTSYLQSMSENERRACECLFDVAAAGSQWAKADANAAVLVDELKADVLKTAHKKSAKKLEYA